MLDTLIQSFFGENIVFGSELFIRAGVFILLLMFIGGLIKLFLRRW